MSLSHTHTHTHTINRQQVFCFKTTSKGTHKYALHTSCIFTRMGWHLQSYSGSLCRHLTHYAELLLESMLASLGTSVTAFLLPGQVTLQEARSGPKTAT